MLRKVQVRAKFTRSADEVLEIASGYLRGGETALEGWRRYCALGDRFVRDRDVGLEGVVFVV